MFEFEIKYWGLSNGLVKPQSLCFNLKNKVDDLLKSPPEIDPNCVRALIWKKIGPLSVLDFVENTLYPIDFDENFYEFGFYKDENVEEYG